MVNVPAPVPPLSLRRRRLVLGICCMSLFLVTMDITIVNVALPAIRRDLHATIGGLQWSIDGYTVVVASFLLLAGSMADRFGRRRVFQLGLTLFGLGSLLCSQAGSIEALVGFRILQALGGAMLNPVAMSIIVNTFNDPRERAGAIGVWGAVVGISMAAGPLLGGALVESVGWRSIFWVNVPVAALALVLTARFVPESRAERPRRPDPLAQLLVVVGLFALTAALIDGRRLGWSSWPIVIGLAIALGCGSGLIAWESRRKEPMLDPRFFRSIPFSSATLLAVLAFSAFSGFLFLNSLYLQESRGLRASAAGLMTLPIALSMVICSPLSGWLVGAGKTRLAVVVSGIAMAASAFLLTGLAVATPLWLLLVAYTLFGIGLGTINAPITNAAVSGMPRAQAGVASAVASTSRQVGATLGVALAGTLAGGGIEAAQQAGFAGETHVVFWLITAYGLAIAGLGLLATGKWARASAARVAAVFGAPELVELAPTSLQLAVTE
jgi:EmrB/QacA subfamily drug resistance transporter